MIVVSILLQVKFKLNHFLEHNKVVMERMMRFKDKTPFSIENDIIDDDVNAESMEDQMKDDSVPSEDFAKLSSWSNEVLGDLVKDVSMTSKLDRQPAMVTVWNLGVVRQFIKMEKMRNPDKAGNLYNEEQLAQIVEPKLQLSSSHPGNFLFHSRRQSTTSSLTRLKKM